jgi:FtsP/CotA-like multicopper oxidase with cupredoxin domain
MKPRILLALMLFITGTVAFGQTAQTCNGFDTTGTIPMYFATPTSTGTTACTDYLGKANYANSPLPVGPVDTSATGFTILDGGSGYTAPVVTVSDFYGITINLVTCSATLSAGSIIGITGCSVSTPDFMAPVVNITDSTGSGAIVLAKLASAASGGMRKFVDALPDLKSALGVPDTTTFPGSAGNPAADFYVIGLMQYQANMHSDLPLTTMRGYCQLAAPSYTACVGGQPFYLGPVILAQKDKPVRVLFKNMLPTGTGGNLFIPVDTTYMGAGVNPDGQTYLQNRATLHLHGGATPWISDGTPHQWTVPAGDWQTPVKNPANPAADNLNRGVSTQSVPDMWFDGSGNLIPSCAEKTACAVAGATNDPGNGNMTFYWTNQQGGRLMFYHDHAYGLTRLNVYVGEAAGYLLFDPVEESALAAATAPGTITGTPDLDHIIPLVIQDKTFVPSATQLAAEDPTWNMIAGGGTTPGTANAGDLWFPHVYMPNQNPNDTLGGANAFGRWDYGPWFFPPQNSLTAANPPSAVTIPCTSSAFPGVMLAPTSANTAGGCPITPNPSGTPEGFMDTPLVNGKAYPVLHVAPEAYRFHILSAGNDRTLNLSLFLACGSGGTAAATNCLDPMAAGKEVPMVPAIRGGLGTAGYVWPDELDGRDGGVPENSAKGPSWVQIGTEGGMLPNVAVIPPTPVGFEYNRRSITVLNISTHGLLLGPAERADAIVDFSGFGGKTLILYNDAPAPVPAFDSRIDYYTGDLDEVQTGGAPTTLPGYGPNTRTIMQIVVDQPPTCTPTPPATSCFALDTLKAALPAAFKATQPVPIVPEPTYPVASGGNSTAATYARIQDNSITFTPNAPLNLTEPCSPPSAGCINFDQKAIQELFTLDYGRMNATLGTELPFTNFLTQTTIPFGYVDWPTEIFQDGQTQIWKLTHNGVDTHFIHFHLFNVQVINRVGWDGAVKPPDDNELGWKDTVRMNPLEDIFFALTPISQKLPFPLPDSIRSMDVTMPDTLPDLNISGLDPASGNATITTVNQPVNFGWEYVWHCHILGHEENDMMRSMSFLVAPPAPSAFAAVRDAFGHVSLTWTDNSASESGFNVQSSTDPNFTTGSVINTVLTNGNASLPASAFGGPITVTDNNAPGGVLYYRVQAEDDFQPLSPLVAPFQTQPLFSAWVVTQAGSMTTTAITALPIAYGQNGLVTVSVTSPAGPVTGNVTLTVDNVPMSPQALAAGSTIFTLTLPTVGTHTLAAHFAAQGTFAASSATGTLIVNAAGLTITASSTTVPYGSAIPAITPIPVGLVAPDTVASLGPLVCTTTYTQGSPVGTYPTSCSGAVNANYTFSYVNGLVTVTAVPLTITANNATRAVGAANPLFTATYSGFVNGDTSASLTGTLTCTTTAIASSPAGTYPITCSGQTSTNYTITYVAGTLTVTGAAAPVLTVSPTALTFTSALNVTSAAQIVTVSNTGTAPLRINGITLGGANPGRFGQTNNCPFGLPGLPAGASCTVNVTFTPNTNATRTANLNVNVAAPAVSRSVTLTGTTLRPTVTVTPASIAFGTQPINTTSAPQTVTVQNTGTVPLIINSITMGGANPARFGQSNTCPIGGGGLQAGASCTIGVTFTPNRRVARSATLTIRDNAANSPQTVTLTGTGI